LLGVLIAPIISNKTRIPVIVVEIIFGIIVGTSLLNIITEIEWLNFFSFFGLIYLLFLAGLEIEFEEIRRSIVPVASIATGSLLLPFALGFLLATYIQVNPIFLGVILSTTSLGVVLPIAKSLRGDNSFFQILLGATVLVDVVSMFLLVITLEIVAGSLSFHYLLSITFFLAMFVLPFLVRRIGLRTRI
jgi:Kef-type K+ transport system membrane component KefB